MIIKYGKMTKKKQKCLNHINVKLEGGRMFSKKEGNGVHLATSYLQ